jgi:hypothetical protein
MRWRKRQIDIGELIEADIILSAVTKPTIDGLTSGSPALRASFFLKN